MDNFDANRYLESEVDGKFYEYPVDLTNSPDLFSNNEKIINDKNYFLKKLIDSEFIENNYENIIEYDLITRNSLSELSSFIESLPTTYFRTENTQFEALQVDLIESTGRKAFGFHSQFGLSLREIDGAIKIDFMPSNRMAFNEAKITDSLYQAYKSLEELFKYIDELSVEERVRLEQLVVHGETNYHMALAALRFGFKLKPKESAYFLTGNLSEIRTEFETLKAAGVGVRLDRRYLRYKETPNIKRLASFEV